MNDDRPPRKAFSVAITICATLFLLSAGSCGATAFSTGGPLRTQNAVFVGGFFELIGMAVFGVSYLVFKVLQENEEKR